MNKQQLLDIDNPTDEQAAVQQLLMANSMTVLEATRRVMQRVIGQLPKTKLKELPFSTIVKAVDIATKLSQNETVEDEKPQTPKTTAGK